MSRRVVALSVEHDALQGMEAVAFNRQEVVIAATARWRFAGCGTP